MANVAQTQILSKLASANPRAWAVLILLVSGCFSSEPTGAPPTAEPSDTHTGTPIETIPIEPLPNGTVPEVPAHLVLESCTGWDAQYPLLPEAIVPGSIPSGWEETDPTSDRMAGLGVSAYTCEKIALGEFERGPIHLLFDDHTKGSLPPDCLAASSSGHLILEQVIVSDAEVAEYLNVTYGMPAVPGEFREATEPLPIGGAWTQFWSLMDGDESMITILRDETEESSTNIDTFWWTRGEGLGKLEMKRELATSALSERVGQGKFVEPMLMAQIADGNFEGIVEYFPGVSTTNTFAFFVDHLCTPQDKGS